MKAINEYFDKTFLINFDPDRLQLMQVNCAAINLDFEIFPAIDGWNTDIEWDRTNEGTMPGWTPGAAGLVHTTINIINHAKEQGYNNILILEDDLIFKPNINRNVAEALQGLPNDWELLHFIAHHRQGAEWIAPRLERLRSSWSGQMYAVRESVYDLYLAELNKVNQPIDCITSEIIHPRGKSYCLRPGVIKTEINKSLIRGEEFNHGV